MASIGAKPSLSKMPGEELDCTKATESRIITIPGPKGEVPDVVVTCGSFEFRLFGAILAKHSKFFESALALPFKEKENGRISIEDKDPYVSQAAIFFIYKQEYSDRISNSVSQEHEPLSFNALMYALAVEYGMPDMRPHAIKKTEVLLRRVGTDNVELAKAIEIIHTSTPGSDRGLRDVVTPYVAKEFVTPAGRKALRRVLEELPVAGHDVASHLADEVKNSKCELSRKRARDEAEAAKARLTKGREWNS